MRFNRKGD
jgi:hypothetical protein